MNKDFLAYWKPSAVDAQVKVGGVQRYAASSQYRRVAPGDTVWIVTVRDGRLHLVTRILVEQVTDRVVAAAALGVPAEDLWDAKCHIVAESSTAVKVLDRDIHDLALELRFISSSGNDRLTLKENGKLTGQQFQALRQLTSESALRLASVMNDVN